MIGETTLTGSIMAELFNNIYRFERELGKGGSGRGFRPIEAASHRLVAIKQLNNQDADAQRQIVREIRAVACFNHPRSEEHTSELQSRQYLVCRLLLEKK